jgi:hypothetical protein
MTVSASFSPVTLLHFVARAGADIPTQSNKPPIARTFAISQSFLAHGIFEQNGRLKPLKYSIFQLR